MHARYIKSDTSYLILTFYCNFNSYKKANSFWSSLFYKTSPGVYKIPGEIL